MTRRNASPVGGFQPFLFFIGMSLVALSFSIFICFSVFYAVQSVNPVASQNKMTRATESVAHKEVYTSLN